MAPEACRSLKFEFRAQLEAYISTQKWDEGFKLTHLSMTTTSIWSLSLPKEQYTLINFVHFYFLSALPLPICFDKESNNLPTHLAEISNQTFLSKGVKWRQRRLSSNWERFWNKKLKLYVFYCIKQIDSMLPCVCSVTDHGGRQNVVRTSVTNVLTTFWRHLWSITEQTHGNMESIC